MLRVLIALIFLIACSTSRPVPNNRQVAPETTAEGLKREGEKALPQAVAPKEFPRIPPPDAAAAEVPAGYQVEVVLKDLIYPTTVEFDDRGTMYVAEAGYSYGDLVSPARVLAVSQDGKTSLVADQLNGPVTDLLWHQSRLYISHRGKISVFENGAVRDLVTDLPSFGDHHNNQLTAGPDGFIYFGQGTATNSGVVGLDNVFPYLWLTLYPDVHDLSPRDLKLEGTTFNAPDPLTVLARQGEMVHVSAAVGHLVSKSEPLLVETGAFQPFGKSSSDIKAAEKPNGVIYRMKPDGSSLEVYAWGLRNPFGLRWGPDGKLYAADNGYDERGSRPIANAPDSIWEIKQNAWYGFPDFAGGTPVTDPQFKSTRGEAPKFLLKEHPPVEKPVLTRPHHAGVTKFDFSRSKAFGFEGAMFLAEVGAGAPVTAPGEVQAGYQVVAVDLNTKQTTPFFGAKKSTLGPRGYSYAVTAAPKRPVSVRFSPDGNALYVVDFGAMTAFPAGAGPVVRPFPGSGVIWRVTKQGSKVTGPPANLSMSPPRVTR